MATVDIIEVILNTRYASARVVDWVDQAILWTSLGLDRYNERRSVLNLACIRTATSFEALMKAKGKVELAGIDSEALFSTIQTNPNLALVRNWRDIGIGPKRAD
ncbi:MAG: hypothetical protein JW395_3249 [Nitrospira sp.]|nr:hypothetical protein [Nitrospira sp.]